MSRDESRPIRCNINLPDVLLGEHSTGGGDCGPQVPALEDLLVYQAAVDLGRADASWPEGEVPPREARTVLGLQTAALIRWPTPGPGLPTPGPRAGTSLFRSQQRQDQSGEPAGAAGPHGVRQAPKDTRWWREGTGKVGGSEAALGSWGR